MINASIADSEFIKDESATPPALLRVQEGGEGDRPALSADDALAQFNRMTDDIDSLYELVYVFYHSGRYQEAKKICRFILLIKPFDQNTLIRYSKINQKLGEYEEAMLGFRKAFGVNTENPKPLLYAVECALKLKDLDRAKVYLVHLLSKAYKDKHKTVVEEAQRLLDLVLSI